MPSTSDSTHAKNITNLERLISFCTGEGKNYKPAREALTIEKLRELHTLAGESITATYNAKTALDMASNERRTAFKFFRTFCTQIINALAASGIDSLTLADARLLHRKIQGTTTYKARKLKALAVAAAGDGEAPKTISTSQQSCDNIIEHFSNLIHILALQPDYKPNEKALQIPSLQALLEKMRTLDNNYSVCHVNWMNSIMNRNEILYKKSTGLVPVALDVKNYMKSIYGSASPEFKRVKAINFRNFMSK